MLQIIFHIACDCEQFNSKLLTNEKIWKLKLLIVSVCYHCQTIHINSEHLIPKLKKKIDFSNFENMFFNVSKNKNDFPPRIGHKNKASLSIKTNQNEIHALKLFSTVKINKKSTKLKQSEKKIIKNILRRVLN